MPRRRGAQGRRGRIDGDALARRRRVGRPRPAPGTRTPLGRSMSARLLFLVLRGSLLANGFRLALTLACIALGVALGGAVHTVHTSALAEIDRAAHVLSGTADVEIRGPRSGFDDALFATVARHPDVEVASPVLELSAALADGEGSVRVLGIDPLRAVRLQPAFVADAAKTGAGEATALLDPSRAWLTP